jgi:hypothetical protein
MNLSPADLDTMRQALIDLQANLDEAGPCDHPVNICVCGLRTSLSNIADLFHRMTDGQVGHRAQPEPTDFPATMAEANGNMGDIAMAMMREITEFRIRQLAIEADARNTQFKKGTIND